MDVGGWVAFVTGLVLIAVAWGESRTKIASHGRAINSLWEKKAEAELFRELKTKVEGVDNWTHEHEREANEHRLQSTEKFASIQKAIEISMNNHQELIRLIGRLEGAIDKMENKFEGLTKKMEDAMSRRRD